ncbi:MAG: Cof-type HAD-IIB family hydrolase [Eubacterium sp.]|nr:Cof-type HAD-IIB family hydrolase [Eubacterium sp.]
MKNLMLCIDVDATIVDIDGNFYPDAKWICEKLDELNWNVVLCSARPLKSLITLASSLSVIKWVSGLGGTVISHRSSRNNDLDKWEICYHAKYLNKNAVNQIIDWTNQNDINDLWFYDTENWYVTRKSDRVNRESLITGLKPIICSIDNISKDKILKIVLPHIPIELFPSLNNCADNVNLSASYSTKTQVEINDSIDIDKGVKKLCNLLFNDEKSVVMALGDGANDYGMLLYSDIPLTFEDGNFQLLKISKYVLNKNRQIAYHEILHLVSNDIKKQY